MRPASDAPGRCSARAVRCRLKARATDLAGGQRASAMRQRVCPCRARDARYAPEDHGRAALRVEPATSLHRLDAAHGRHAPGRMAALTFSARILPSVDGDEGASTALADDDVGDGQQRHSRARAELQDDACDSSEARRWSMTISLLPCSTAFFAEGGGHRMIHRRVGADDDDDRRRIAHRRSDLCSPPEPMPLEQRRHRRRRGTAACSGRRCCCQSRRAHQLLETGPFLGALSRPKPASACLPSRMRMRFRPSAAKRERLPARLAEIRQHVALTGFRHADYG